VLTATVLGGISLGGGKGSVAKALAGTLIVLFVINGLTTLSVSGGVNRMILAGVLLVAATIDIRWLKNRTRIISKVYVSPTYHGLAPAASTEPGSGRSRRTTSWRDVTLIGLGRIEAPEDVILDRPTTISTPVPATATSSASARPIIRRWKCSPISAASRSAWPSIARIISMSHRRDGPLSHHARSQGREGDG